MTLDTLVFGLAITGYAALGLSAMALALGRGSRLLSALTALIVVSHVIGVWAHRFGWSLVEATKNGWRGFFLFHFALVAIVAAALIHRHASLFTHAGFVVVTGGAVGAVFKYDFVSHLRVPVLVVAGVTLAVVLFAYGRHWRGREG